MIVVKHNTLFLLIITIYKANSYESYTSKSKKFFCAKESKNFPTLLTPVS